MTTKRSKAATTAAATLGRLGGRRNTPAQAVARRANAKLGGHPRRVCADCSEPVNRSYHLNPALDATCATRESRWQSPSERREGR